MVGPLIYGFSEDPVAAAKVIADFAKTNDKLVIKAGAHAGKMLDAKGVQSLAAIPSKEVLLSQLLGLMQSPMTRIARVLAMLAEKREAPAATEPAAEEPAAASLAAESASAAPAASEATPPAAEAPPAADAPAAA